MFGRTEHGSRYDGGQMRKATRRRSRDEWLSLLPGHHVGYVAWEQFEQVQQMIAANCHEQDRPGAARQGGALLARLLRCRRCGRKLTVGYSGGNGSVVRPGERFLRYACARGYLDNGEPKCISFGGVPVDAGVAQEVLRVVEPAAVEAAVQASQEMTSQQDAVLQSLQRDLQAAQYQASRAQKQYDAADPENRLVAEELERRWNQALLRVQELECRLEQQRSPRATSAPVTPDEFSELAEELEAVWNDPQTDSRLKKRLVRALMHEVLVDIDGQMNEVVLVIHWQGGVHTELRVPRRRRGSATRTSLDIVEAVRALAQVSNDQAIAGFLNRNELKTGRGNRWTKERVISLRSYHQIPLHCPQRKAEEGWLTLTEAAKLRGVSSRTLRLAVERGEIPGQHPLADGPWILRRADLQTPAAEQFVQRTRQRTVSHPAVLDSQQKTLGFSHTSSKGAL